MRIILPALALLLAQLAGAQTAPFPLQAGEAVVTCFSGADPNGFVAAVFDVRDPAANSPGVDRNWLPPVYHHASWTAGTFGGEVFGLALDDAASPNVYLTSTSTYGQGQLGSGKVYKIDGTTSAVSVLVELPPTCGILPCLPPPGPGLGNVAFDPVHRQLFVTNFHDGKIYRLSLAGEILGTFDPFAPFDPGAAVPAPAFAPLGERPWGIAVYAGRVYFGVWASDYRLGGPNTVWSVALDGAGAFTGSERLEVTLPLAPFPSSPVADIAFTVEGTLLLAQRTMIDDTSPGAHQSAVLEYSGGPGAWSPSGRTFAVGIPPGRNAAGGVAAVTAEGAGGGTAFVLATGDSLHFTATEKIYGLQILPAAGGSIATSYLIDLDGDTTQADKLAIGDVEVANPEAGPPVVYDDVDIILHTGWDRPNQELLPPGSDDDEWQVKVGATTGPAKVIVEPLPAWRDPFLTGRWIGANAAGLAAPGVATVVFERCFCLGPDATDFEEGSDMVGVIKLRLYADDLALVLVNGVPVGFGGAFRRATPLKFNVEQPMTRGLLHPGATNCIQVEVPNHGVGTGLVLVGKVWLHSAACEPTP
jgi:hypothetical protein